MLTLPIDIGTAEIVVEATIFIVDDMADDFISINISMVAMILVE